MPEKRVPLSKRNKEYEYSGDWLISLIRKKHPRKPIICLTGIKDFEKQANTNILFLTKPVLQKRLIDMIESKLNH